MNRSTLAACCLPIACLTLAVDTAHAVITPNREYGSMAKTGTNSSGGILMSSAAAEFSDANTNAAAAADVQSGGLHALAATTNDPVLRPG